MRADRVAWLGLVAQTVSFGLNFSAGVFFPPVIDAYGLDGATLAVAAALAAALTGLVQPLVGLLLDHLGARRVLLAGLTLIASSYLVLAVVQNTWQFVAVYVVLGGLGFAASASMAVSTLIGRAYGDRAAPALARAAIGINLGQLVAPWAATALFAPVGVRAAYAALGATALAVVLWLSAVLPPDPARTEPAPRRARVPARVPVLASFALHAATLYALVLLLPKHASELGWTDAAAGRLVAVSAVTAGLTSAAVVRLLRHRRPESLLRSLHLVRAAALALAATGRPALLVPVAVLFGVASFPVIPLTMAVLTRGLDPARLGRALIPAWVLHQMSAGAGLALATVLHGATGGYRAFFGLGLLLSLAAAPLAGAAVPRKARTSINGGTS